MAVGLKAPGTLLPVAGVKLGAVEAGIRYQGRPDLVLMELDEGSSCAAVFTQNKCCAAPVTLAKEHLQTAAARALLINSGNANAVTGEVGMQNAVDSCAAVAGRLGVDTDQILPFSTGVIGEQLNMSAMLNGIDRVSAQMAEDNWLVAAEAIMTTDTLAKAVSRQVAIGGTTITITGMAKGSGMMCPNMATLLAYVATDAAISPSVLEEFLKKGADASFNSITVDGDTSTNDALVLMATGKSGVELESTETKEQFYGELEAVLIELATAIVRDAEGATKFVTVDVLNAASEHDANAVAYTIAHSPLVKTALFASDPNWGRILMALGKSPIDVLDMVLVDIQIGEVSLIEKGQPAPSYTEERGQSVFERDEITITIDLNAGNAHTRIWTSDLSHDYVSINADYRS